MSWQSCPHCQGQGSIGFQGIPCPVCLGKRIIDEETGSPPVNINISTNNESKIFSGEESEDFWKLIRSVTNTSTMNDLYNLFYLLGCMLQRLESKVDKLK